MLALSDSVCSRTTQGAANARNTRLRAACSWRSSSTLRRISTNSSPDNRATASAPRKILSKRCATSTSSRSPTACP
ncbi:hypothetical protein D3C80_1558780 [compost metagenome]